MIFSNEKRLFTSFGVGYILLFFTCLNLGGIEVDGSVTSSTNCKWFPICSWTSPGIFEQEVNHDLLSVLDNGVRNASIYYATHVVTPVKDTDEQIFEEVRLGEIELLAQLIEAEAGNQDFDGKRLVADVVLNRRDAGWEENIYYVIFHSGQFSCIYDGGFDRAGWNISEDSYKAAMMEYEANPDDRLDGDILYFTAGGYNKYCVPMYSHGDHYFGK